MVAPSDFIRLDYTADLTEAGIAYARRYLFSNPSYQGVPGFPEMLRGCIAGVAAELAFRRYLVQHRIPHKNLEATPFTKPGRLEISIGERRCDIQMAWVTRKNQIRELHKDPANLLDTPATVSKDQLLSDSLQDEDLYIFAFLEALLTPNLRSLKKAVQANQPVFLIYGLPQKWSHPAKWGSPGTLVVKSDCSDTFDLTLGGWAANRQFQTEQVTLLPGVRTTTNKFFYALHTLHTRSLPQGSLEVHSPTLDNTHLVRMIRWRNLWVYGLQIILAGYITRGEFRQQADDQPFSNHQYHPRVPADRLSLLVSSLHPLQDLFDRARSWGVNRPKPGRQS